MRDAQGGTRLTPGHLRWRRYATNRFARNAHDYAVITTLLLGFGIRLRSATETITDDPAGKLTANLLAAIAQFENDQKAQRTRDGMAAALQKGQWTWRAQFMRSEAGDWLKKNTLRGDKWTTPMAEFADPRFGGFGGELHATTITTNPASGGVLVTPQYLPTITPILLCPPIISDLLGAGTTGSNLIVSIAETAITVAAAAVAEGAPKPEGAITFAQVQEPVQKLSWWLPCTEELLSDIPAMNDYIDTRLRKARAGHVTGGALFGYDNIEVRDATGQRSHVERRINEREAAIVRRIFELRAQGIGQVRIAKQLNAEGVTAPRSQQSRPRAWAPSSVREVLFRETYRGIVVWNRSRKRNQWGQHKQAPRPTTEWMRMEAPQLRIVSERLWRSAHQRMDAARPEYDRVTRLGRRPTGDRMSKYFLPGMGRCSLCGGGLHVRSRSHGHARAFCWGGGLTAAFCVPSKYDDCLGRGLLLMAQCHQQTDGSPQRSHSRYNGPPPAPSVRRHGAANYRHYHAYESGRICCRHRPATDLKDERARRHDSC